VALAFVDLESIDLGGGGTRHYLELLRFLSRENTIFMFARSMFIEKYLKHNFKITKYISYEPRSLLDLKAYFDGIRFGKSLDKIKGVISTTTFFNTYMFSLGISSIRRVPLIILAHHKPRLKERVRLLGLKGLATYLFYFPAVYSNYYYTNSYILYTQSTKRLGFRNYNNIWIRIQETAFNTRMTKKDIDICYLGRCTKMKGFHEFLYVCSKLRERFPSLKVVVMGSSVQLKIPSWINYLGFVDEQLKYEILSRSKVFLFLSHEEGFSISIVEAMCNRAVVISWDLPEYPFKNIIRVKEGNIDEIIKNLEKILVDSQKLEEMSIKAYEEAKSYISNELMYEEIDFILKIIQKDG